MRRYRSPAGRRRPWCAGAAAVALAIASRTARTQPAGPGAFAVAARGAVETNRAATSTQMSALRRLYADDGVAPLWTAGGRPTAQATAALAILGEAASFGLDARDYDADRVSRAAATLADDADSATLARFDVAMSRSVVQLLSDLHEGRENPRAVGAHLPDAHRGLDLAAIALAVSRAARPDSVVAAAEPPYAGYAALKEALAGYRALASDTSLRPPAPSRTALRPGDRYADAAALRRLLVALGDMAPAAAGADSLATDVYTAATALAVISFQRRHGLGDDGVLGPATMAALRVPLARRVRQIELTLERWRWLPDSPPERYAAVNVPAFRLYVFEHDPTASRAALRMNVIVGQAGRQRATPIFTGTMSEVVFRPFWDVPPSIARKEVIPDVRRKPGYYEREGLEIVRGGDEGAVIYSPTSYNLDRVVAGTLRIRQRPGPRNALGAVKFVFPNSYNVYLHGTPATQLFAETRRDFSHGCIRVEDPLALAEWVLRGQPGWDRAAVEAAAREGAPTRRVKLARPVAVYVLYVTVARAPDGKVHFYSDLYGRDASLERALAARRSTASAAE
ncbi:MAG TPA: L,D-transpeptidase family protein [Gemmatimonadaceae bacterium]|nr:L,D-transpeptidase family protein [Gemmatimonadaceae bacterium]